jgi:hypothetical protein
MSVHLSSKLAVLLHNVYLATFGMPFNIVGLEARQLLQLPAPVPF